MSEWTYIKAMVRVSIMGMDKVEVSRRLGRLPAITGSEHNALVSTDINGRSVGIQVYGTLRDRQVDETQAEWKAFLECLRHEFGRKNVSVTEMVLADDPFEFG